MLTQVLPYPPDSGPKVKTWNVLRHLNERHQITLVSFVRGDQSEDLAGLSRYCDGIYPVQMERSMGRDLMALGKSFMTGIPWIIQRDERKSMYDQVAELCSRHKFDLIYADQLNMAQYAETTRNIPRLLDTHNCLWLLYKRLVEMMNLSPMKWIYQRDWQLLKTYEGRVITEFDIVTAVSEQDKRALEEASQGKRKQIDVIPITVDLQANIPLRREINGNRLVYLGTLHWAPNSNGLLWFLEEVFSFIQQEIPDIELDILGARPPREILAHGEKNPHIHVRGYVEDPAEYLTKASALVVPLRAGGGMRVRILNELAQEIPIVTTSIGCEGIDVENGKQLFIADNPYEFAQRVIELCRNPEIGFSLGKNGRQLIQEKYDYRIACRALDEILEGMR